MDLPAIPLPRAWSAEVQRAFVQAMSLAHSAMTFAQGWCANSPLERVRLATEVERLRAEVAMLGEELRIKDARMARIAPRSRPHYPPPERLAVLALRAARAWTLAQAAQRFHLTPQTLRSWGTRLDEEGEDALVRTPVPVNRFPDFVGLVVRQLRAVAPLFGRKRIADLLARAGLHLAPSTVARMMTADSEPGPRKPTRLPQRDVPEDPVPAANLRTTDHTVTARYPHHVWHIDISLVPIAGTWAAWPPFALLQRWPFYWAVLVVLDHHSRAVVHAAVLRRSPSADQTVRFIDEAVAIAGRAPRHLISDRGCQFRDAYLDCCQHHGIRPRFGALGQHGSIAVIERFFRSLKQEGLRHELIARRLADFRAQLFAYLRWYNDHRPHSSLAGATPREVRDGLTPAREAHRIEPRPLWPLRPDEQTTRLCGAKLELCVTHTEGRAHLPIVDLRRAA